MTKIKIISNPYLREITYKEWKESEGAWIEATHSDMNSSSLLSKECISGFFPFNVKKIIDGIKSEYRNGDEIIDVIFEGTDDEFEDIKAVCDKEEYRDSIHLECSETSLENARDILPGINQIFKEVSPLVAMSVKDQSGIQDDLRKFSDAAADVVPICVMGNYSTGKSTFINALIGCEILPSGDEPVTAKIYRIQNSQDDDRASVGYEYLGVQEKILFEKEKYRFDGVLETKPLNRQIVTTLDEMEGEPIASRVRRVLEIINDSQLEEWESANDIIDISIPFCGDIWNRSSGKYLIFDTPGSNSASNNKHFQVLKDALNGLSNGLPVYISEYNALDTTDNEKLYEEIKTMDSLDDRFTMIVVNKADTADLPEAFTKNDVRRILNLATPRNMYSEGIYFVSSIMGLGAKTNGEFAERNSKKIYKRDLEDYEDKDSEFYTSLYKYNIMEDHLKEKADEVASECENLVYANSGIFSVEQEIQTFARKYSSYNKCSQAQRFLDKVMNVTEQVISDETLLHQKYKKEFEDKLAEGERILLDQIKDKGNVLICEFVEEYPSHMERFVQETKTQSYTEDMSEDDEETTEKQKEEKGLKDKQEDVRQAKDALKENFLQDLQDAIRNKDFDSIAKIRTQLSENLKKVSDSKVALEATVKQVNQDISDDLINLKKDDYKKNSLKAQLTLYNESKKFWTEKSEKVKDELSKIVTGSDEIDPEKKKELKNMIFAYQGVEFEKQADIIFRKDAFDYAFRIGKFHIGQLDKIDVNKLRNRYNQEIIKNIDNIYSTIDRTHGDSFKNWFDKLLDSIRELLVEYNPDLHERAKWIAVEEGKIQDLEERHKKLMQYNQQVKEMLDWKHN